MERRSDPRILLGFSCVCFSFVTYYTLSSGRNRRKHYGLLVPPTDDVNLILLHYGSDRGKYMDLVFEGVLSHPSTCHGPCSPALSYCTVYCSL